MSDINLTVEAITSNPHEILEKCRRLLNHARRFDTPDGLDSYAVASEMDRVLAHPPTVLIEVQGGVAECTSWPPGVEVVVIDHDNEWC